MRTPDPWDDDDPALMRTRAAIATWTQEPVGRPETPDPVPVVAEDPRRQVENLRDRLRSGDLSVVGALREMLADLHR